MRCCDQGAHNRERLTANRSDLTLQGGPNQHVHVFALSDNTNQPFPSPPRTTEPPHLHIVSRAQWETTNSKYIHPHFSATTRLALRGGDEVLYFRREAVLGLPVSTTSYSRHTVSTVQSPISTANNGSVLNRHVRTKHFSARSPLSFPFILEFSSSYYWNIETPYISRVIRKLLDFYRTEYSIARLSSDKF